MEVIKTTKDLRERLKRESRVACVPTMGNIHDGHLSLVRIAREHAPVTVTTIFVNRLQFGQGDDFEKYPRTLEEDCAKLEAGGNTIVFAPDEKQMYPEPQVFYIDLPKVASKLEGRFRPGHFRGMATVVLKLFNSVQPQIAVFGKKDYQQLAIVRHMVEQFALPITIIPAETVRAEDGLALSSRNRFLSPAERKEAIRLRQAILQVKDAVERGDRNLPRLESRLCRCAYPARTAPRSAGQGTGGARRREARHHTADRQSGNPCSIEKPPLPGPLPRKRRRG